MYCIRALFALDHTLGMIIARPVILSTPYINSENALKGLLGTFDLRVGPIGALAYRVGKRGGSVDWRFLGINWGQG